MIRIGPITIMSTRTREAYKHLANAAYRLHQTIWHTDDMCSEVAQDAIRDEDERLSAAISHTPPEDIE